MRNLLFLSWLSAMIAISSCQTTTSSDPNSTGKGSEILVVCDKVLWDGAVGNTIRQALTVEMEGLPESEPIYTLINVPYAKFSRFLQTHRNVLIVDIQPEFSKAHIESQKNTWSKPQRVIKIMASGEASFIKVFNQYQVGIRDMFDQNERARFGAQNALSRNLKVESLLEKDFGIRMIVSSDFYQAKNQQDFLWLRKETNEVSLGILVYTFPYTDTNQLAEASILRKRNEITQANIPGPSAGSYMVATTEFIKPVSRKVQFNKSFAIETRGLWQTQGDFMGGPFVNYTIVDTLRQRIVTFDGFVYYPNKEKRNYIRQLESIIWGAEFISPDTSVK